MSEWNRLSPTATGNAHNLCSKRWSHSISQQLWKIPKETQTPPWNVVVTSPKAPTDGPSTESNIVILSLRLLLNNHSALMRCRTRTEARYILKAEISIYLLNFERRTRDFIYIFSFVFSVLLHLHSSSLLFKISGEPRRTGFDNDDWPSMWGFKRPSSRRRSFLSFSVRD